MKRCLMIICLIPFFIVINHCAPDIKNINYHVIWEKQYNDKENKGINPHELFFAYNEGYLYCVGIYSLIEKLDIKTGSTLWQYFYKSLGNDNLFCPPLIDNNILFTGSLNGGYIAIDCRTGKELWKITQTDKNGIAYCAEPVSGTVKRNNLIIAGKSTKDRMRGFIDIRNKNDGSRIKSILYDESGSYIETPPMTNKDFIYFISLNSIKCYDKGFNLKWDSRLSNNYTQVFMIKPILTDNYFLYNDFPFLTAVEADTGKEKWKLGSIKNMISSKKLLLKGNKIYFKNEPTIKSEKFQIYCIDIVSSKILWIKDLLYNGWSDSALYGTGKYIFSYDTFNKTIMTNSENKGIKDVKDIILNYLLVIDAENGNIKYKMQLPGNEIFEDLIAINEEKLILYSIKYEKLIPGHSHYRKIPILRLIELDLM